MSSTVMRNSAGLPPWYADSSGHFAVEKLRSHFEAKKHLNALGLESTVLSLTLRGVTPNTSYFSRGLSASDFTSYQIVEPGDLILRLIDLSNTVSSRVGYVAQRGVVSPAYVRLTPRGTLDTRFAYWQLTDLNNKSVFHALSGGVRATLSASELVRMPFVVPPLDIQVKVAKYLDHAEIRFAKAISAKQAMIALLREREQRALLAAISETSGERRTDPRVEWLGSFPDHWDIARLGSLLEERGEVNHDGHVTQVLSLVRKRGVMRYEDKGNIGNKKSEDVTRYKIVRNGDIVLNSMNVIIGSVGLSEYTGCLSPVYYVLKPRSSAHSSAYFNALFQIERFHSSLVRFGKGILAHRLRIPMIELKTVMLPVAPPAEQAEIAERVATATQVLRSSLGAIEREIALLKEYRVKLISDVVTGKLDVTKEAAGLPDIDPEELAHVLSGASSGTMGDEEGDVDGDD